MTTTWTPSPLASPRPVALTPRRKPSPRPRRCTRYPAVPAVPVLPDSAVVVDIGGVLTVLAPPDPRGAS